MTVKIANRFNGPDQSGNGGYVCGLLDFHSPFAVSEVTLKMPPPLEKDLSLNYEKDKLSLMDGEQVIGYAKKAQLDLDVPPAPTFVSALKAIHSFIGQDGKHIFPHCFVCGPKRHAGDGLRIFPGKIAGSNIYAAPWIPDHLLGDDKGKVKTEYLWSALDCPGAFALMGDTMQPMVLGRMTCKIQAFTSIQIGEKCVVMGWPIGQEGRKLYCGTAIYNEGGKLVASAKATWIRVELARFAA